MGSDGSEPGTGGVQVVFVGGYGRSGTTLLEKLLARGRHVFALGELCHIWRRSLLEDQLCGCGAPFSRCRFWSEALAEAWPETRPPARELEQIKRHLVRFRRLPYLLNPQRLSDRARRDYDVYRSAVGSLLGAVSRTSGAPVLVDSSKDPAHGAMLLSLPGVTVTYVHMVRDSRAVAYSWSRQRRRPEVTDRVEFMPRYSTGRSSLEWCLYNLATARVARFASHRLLVRYEDLVARPQEELAALLKHTAADLAAAADETSYHSVSGNPMRLAQGPPHLRLDDEWRRSMRPMQKLAATSLTGWLLRSYGYRLRW